MSFILWGGAALSFLLLGGAASLSSPCEWRVRSRLVLWDGGVYQNNVMVIIMTVARLTYIIATNVLPNINKRRREKQYHPKNSTKFDEQGTAASPKVKAAPQQRRRRSKKHQRKGGEGNTTQRGRSSLLRSSVFLARYCFSPFPLCGWCCLPLPPWGSAASSPPPPVVWWRLPLLSPFGWRCSSPPLGGPAVSHFFWVVYPPPSEWHCFPPLGGAAFPLPFWVGLLPLLFLCVYLSQKY